MHGVTLMIDSDKLSTSSKIRAFKGTIELMSELFFTSLEVGNTYVTEPIILSTALYYALGYANGNYITIPEGKRKHVKQQPSYVEDTNEIFNKVYITPAKPLRNIRSVTENYNARSDDYIQKSEDMGVNIPQYGARKQIQQGAQFLFYLLAFDGFEPNLLPYVRIGKKKCKCLIEWEEVHVKTATGQYHTTHPILSEDINVKMLGDIIFKRMLPFDIIEQATFSGGYIKIGDDILPADARFLRRLRKC